MIDIETIGVAMDTTGLKAGQRELDNTTAAANKTADAADHVSKRSMGMSGAFDTVATNARLMAGAVATIATSLTLMNVVSVQREFDVMNASLVTVTGSSARAQVEFAWLKEFAATTPYGLSEVTQGFVKMKALGLDPSRAALTSYGNTASAMGKSLNQMIEAVADAATGEFERLKEFGIKAKQQGDQVSLTFQGVTKTIGNNAAEITQYLKAIGNNEFASAMAERAKTLDGALSNLGDTWNELYLSVSAAGVGSVIYDGVTLANAAVGDAINILNALKSATSASAQETGLLKAAQEAIAVVFETITVLGVNVKYVLVAIGNEIGGIAAQIVALATLDFKGFSAIGQAMRDQAAEARREVDATTDRILNARRLAEIAQTGVGMDEPRFARLLKATYDQSAAIQHVGRSSKEASEAAKELAREQKLIAELGGYTATFIEDWNRLEGMYKKGKISIEQLREAQQKLLQQQPIIKKNTEAATKAQEEANKVMERAQDSMDKYTQAQWKEVESLKSGNQQLEEQIYVLQFGEEALVRRQIQQLRNTADAKLLGVAEGEVTDALREQAEELRKRATLLEQGIAVKEARAATDAWRQTADSISTSLTDAILRGLESGKGMLQALGDAAVNMFKTLVLRPIIAPTSAGLAALFGGGQAMAGAADGGGSGSGSGLSNLLGIGSSIGAFGSHMATGLMNTLFGTGASAGMSAAGGLMSAGQTSAGLGMGAGAAIPYVAVAALVANALGLFRKTKKVGEGLTGTLGAGDIEGYDLMRKSGTLFSGPDYSLRNTGVAEQSTAIQAAYQAMRDNTADMIERLGLNGDAVRSYTTTLGSDVLHNDTGGIGLKLTGLSPEEAAAKVQAALEVANEELAKLALGANEFAKEGETAVQTLQRLTAIQGLSESLNPLGGIFSLIANASIGAREELAALAGGIDNLMGQAGSFVKNFYSQDEQMGLQARMISDALAAVGIDASQLQGRQDYRELVESFKQADLEDPAKQQQIAALLGLGDQFVGVSEYLKENNMTLADAIKNAPDIPILQSMLNPQQATADNTSSMASSLTTISGQLAGIQQAADAAAAAAGVAAAAAGQAAGAAGAAAGAAASAAAAADLAASRPTYDYDMGRA